MSDDGESTYTTTVKPLMETLHKENGPQYQGLVITIIIIVVFSLPGFTVALVIIVEANVVDILFTEDEK